MKHFLFTLLMLIVTSTYHEAHAQRENRTAIICYSGEPFRTDRALNRCAAFCEDNNLGKAVGWSCGSDINCGNSQCQCVCKNPYREEYQDYQRRDDGGSIKIPFGDKFQLEIR